MGRGRRRRFRGGTGPDARSFELAFAFFARVFLVVARFAFARVESLDGGGGVRGVGRNPRALRGVDDDEDAAVGRGVLEECAEGSREVVGVRRDGSAMANRRFRATHARSRKCATSCGKLWSANVCVSTNGAVSYTHLTLPTILLV